MWDLNRDGFYIDYNKAGEAQYISVFYNDDVFDISKGEPRFSSVYRLINEEKFDEIPKFLNNKAIFDEIEKYEGFENRNGILYIKDEPVPSMLGTHILEFYHGGFDISNLLNFWESLRKNTDQVIREDLFEYLKKEGITILPDGSFLSYRTVNEDFKDIWTKTVDNSIGTVVSMDREKVNANRNNSAGAGLHIATIKKAISFGNWTIDNDVRLLAVKVRPEDVIVGINLQSDEAYIRCCEYKVLTEIKDGKALTLTEVLQLCQNI
jgi:hypothetical protein